MDLSLREARPDDADSVLALVRDVVSRRPVDIPMEPDELPWTLAQERDILLRYAENPSALFLLALEGSRIVGQLSLRPGELATMRHVAALGMSVAPGRRGRGIGRALLEEALRWARRAPNLTRLDLDVYARNAPARHLYESLGFEYETYRRCAVLEPGVEREAPPQPLDCLGMGLLFEDKQPAAVALHGSAYEPASPAPPAARWHVRDARPADAEAICRMYMDMRQDPALLVPTTALGYEPDVGERRRRIEESAGGDNIHVIVAESEGVVIGSLEARGGRLRALQHEAHVALDVADGWRARGVGRAMIEALLERVQASGRLRRLALVVYAENAPAIGLYESCGFEHEGRRRSSFFQAGRYHDDLLMARLLA